MVLKTSDPQSRIIELEFKVKELTSELDDAKKQIRALQEKLVQSMEVGSHNSSSWKFVHPFYYTDGDPVPFCRHCWETEKVKMHLPPPFSTGIGPCYKCSKCKNEIFHPPLESKGSRSFGA